MGRIYRDFTITLTESEARLIVDALIAYRQTVKNEPVSGALERATKRSKLAKIGLLVELFRKSIKTFRSICFTS
jgi:hypothetical protein